MGHGQSMPLKAAQRHHDQGRLLESFMENSSLATPLIKPTTAYPFFKQQERSRPLFMLNPTQSYVVPLELIRQVFDDVDAPADLAKLTQCSKLFQAESQRLLYRSMTHKSGTVHFKFFSIIIKKPHLASMVEVYHRHCDPHAQRRPLTTLIIRALPLMTNLKELVFGQDALRLDIKGLPAFISPKCSFQLETLVSAKQWEADEIMNMVLELPNVSRTLKHLHWNYSYAEDVFTDNTIPQLTSFAGSLKVAKFVLLGRNVMALKIIEGEFYMDSEYLAQFQSIETELGRIESFCVAEHWHHSVHPRQFFQLMPALRIVEIRDLTLEVSDAI